MSQEVEAEEAMLYLPIGDKGFALFEQLGDPSVADVGIERGVHVVNHPIDWDACLGLAEIIAIASLVHILDCQYPCGEERLEGIEAVGATGIDHRPGGEYEIDLLADIRFNLSPKLLKGVAKDIVPFHSDS